MFSETLVVSQIKCPPSCSLCMEACAKSKKDGSHSRIRKMDLPGEDVHSVLVCNQCSQPECSNICPTGAISRSDAGVVTVNGDRCIGCGLCALACPYGGIYLDEKTKAAYKCDLCDGSPKCAEACVHGVLTYRKAASVVDKLNNDILTRGLPFCAGCLMELFARFTLRFLGKDIILFGSPSCCILGARCDVAYYGCLMTNAASSMTGVKRYFSRIKQDVTCVGIIGDGATADIAFQVLSAAAERGEKIIYICYDNEAYMNTGIQRSSTTPMGSWTTTTQVGAMGRGKLNTPKNVPLLMAFHNIAYTATASLAHLDDYAAKLQKSMEAVKEGTVYLHVLTPCPTGWRNATEDAIKVSRAAVETNYFPLWEAESGKFRMTHVEPSPKPIREFTKFMGRFAHLSEKEIDAFQEYIDKRYNQIYGLSEKT